MEKREKYWGILLCIVVKRVLPSQNIENFPLHVGALIPRDKRKPRMSDSSAVHIRFSRGFCLRDSFGHNGKFQEGFCNG